MLLLIETPAGYGLFKLRKKKILSLDGDELRQALEEQEGLSKHISLAAFRRFENLAEATGDYITLKKGQAGPILTSLLCNDMKEMGLGSNLLVADHSLASNMKNKFGLNVIYSTKVNEIAKAIRLNLSSLLEGIVDCDLKTLAVSLSHSLSRYKLRFRADRIDRMVIQAANLLEDLDKELNNMYMRIREWYGFHFPEMSAIIEDNLSYTRIVKDLGRPSISRISKLDVEQNIRDQISSAFKITMGSEMADEDEFNLKELARRIVDLSSYRTSLGEYLKLRIQNLAPNLTLMVGEMVAAKLLCHAGSLMGLAKSPASTIQLLGAEKALFRAFKTKSATPKYGILFQAALIVRAEPNLRGKISRMLASKLALCCRVDALKESPDTQIGLACRKYLDQRLAFFTDSSKNVDKPIMKLERFRPKRTLENAQGAAYNMSMDGINPEKMEKPKKKRKHE